MTFRIVNITIANMYNWSHMRPICYERTVNITVLKTIFSLDTWQLYILYILKYTNFRYKLETIISDNQNYWQFFDNTQTLQN